jgi:hypothetical protein
VAESPPAPDNLKCLTLLLTDPGEHAAKCGGPFTVDEGKDPLVKGTFNQGCPLFATIPLSLAGDEWRVQVAAGSVTCCNVTDLMPPETEITMGDVFRFRVAGC